VTLRLIYSGNAGRRRIAMLTAGLAVTFTAIVLMVLRLLPAPHTRTHYLIAGSAPTGIGLLAALIWVERKRFRRRG
jgi:hypothetical protein